MMRASIFVASLVLVGTLLNAAPARAERPLVAVLDFKESRTRLHQDEIAYLTDISRGAALDALGTGFNIITRENLRDLLKAHGTTLERCSEGACETEVGRLLGAEYVVSGLILRAFGAFKLSLKVHRTDPPELLGTATASAKRSEDLEAAVRTSVAELMSKVPGAQNKGGGASRARVDAASSRAPAPSKAQGGDVKLLEIVNQQRADKRAWHNTQAKLAGTNAIAAKIAHLEIYLEAALTDAPHRPFAEEMLADLSDEVRGLPKDTVGYKTIYSVAWIASTNGSGFRVSALVMAWERLVWRVLEVESVSGGTAFSGTALGYRVQTESSIPAEWHFLLGVGSASYLSEDGDEFHSASMRPEAAYVLHLGSGWRCTLGGSFRLYADKARPLEASLSAGIGW